MESPPPTPIPPSAEPAPSASPPAPDSPPAPALPRVSVVALCYKSRDHIPHCLNALADQRADFPFETIVVENAPSDGAADLARAHSLAPRVIVAERNLGCCGGNNLGWRAARGEVVVFLNPDCVVEPDFLAAVTRPLFERPDGVGMTGAKLYYPNTHILQHAGCVLHPNAMTENIGSGEEDRGQYNTPRTVDFVTGAAIAVRRDVLERLGGFDEEFFPAYYEETDLCTRIQRLGLSILYVPEAVGYHLESPTLGKGSPRFVRMVYRARQIYLVKNKGIGEWLTSVIPFEGRWLRQPYSKGARWAVVRSYSQGAWFALRCLLRWNRRPPGIR